MDGLGEYHTNEQHTTEVLWVRRPQNIEQTDTKREKQRQGTTGRVFTGTGWMTYGSFRARGSTHSYNTVGRVLRLQHIYYALH